MERDRQLQLGRRLQQLHELTVLRAAGEVGGVSRAEAVELQRRVGRSRHEAGLLCDALKPHVLQVERLRGLRD